MERQAVQRRPQLSPVVGVGVAGGGAQLGEAVLDQSCCSSDAVVTAAVVRHADAARLPRRSKRHLVRTCEASLRKSSVTTTAHVRCGGEEGEGS